MEDGKPDVGDPEYRDGGTCAHAIAKMCLDENRPATAYIGRRVEVGPCRTYEFTEDMAEPVQCYVDFVRSLPGEKFYEVRVPIGHITGEEGAEGTSDVVALTDDCEEIICVDLKFGRGVYVSAEKNKQGMLYALGALKKYDVLGTIKRIRIFIHQPRINPVPSEWDCTVEALHAFAAEATKAASTAMIAFKFRENWIGKPGDEQYLVAGDHCRETFCKARATCPAAAHFVQESVGIDFETLVPGAVEHNMPAVPAVHDSVLLAKKMAAADLIEDWLKAVRAEVERRLLNAEEVPGYKLVQGRQGNRAWTDEKVAEELLRKTFRLPIEEAYNLKLISPTQAEKVLKEHPRQWAKCEPLIVRADGKPSVAPVSDKRPAITIKPVADDFATVEEGADLV